MKKSIVIAGALAFGMAPSLAHADGPNPWTDCGLGALVFSGVDGDGGKIGAAISNIIWDLGTTAVSSATSSPDTCARHEVTAAAFIHQQLPNV